MSRGGFKITRCGDQHEEPGRSQDSNVPSWMSGFASKAEKMVQADEAAKKEAVTVVDRARDRNIPTVYEQMYAIMNGKKPLYSSVEEAVTDYQKKTGLTQHLEKIQAGSNKSDINAIAKQIVEASSGLDEAYVSDCPEHGGYAGMECPECRTDSQGADDLEKKNSESDKNDSPLIFTVIPSVKDYVDNVVSGNPSLSIPAIVHMIAENFEGDGASSEHLDDENLAHYVSKLLADNAPHHRDESGAMGRDLGLNFESDQNEDAFGGLRPSNSVM